MVGIPLDLTVRAIGWSLVVGWPTCIEHRLDRRLHGAYVFRQNKIAAVPTDHFARPGGRVDVIDELDSVIPVKDEDEDRCVCHQRVPSCVRWGQVVIGRTQLSWSLLLGSQPSPQLGQFSNQLLFGLVMIVHGRSVLWLGIVNNGLKPWRAAD